MKLNTESLALASGRHPWRVVAVWVVAFVVAILLLLAFLGDALTTDFDFTDRPEAVRAEELLEDRFRGPEPFTEFVVVSSSSATATEPDFQGYIRNLEGAIAGLGSGVVENVSSYLGEGGPVSEDGRAAVLPVLLASRDFDTVGKDAEKLAEAVEGVQAPGGIQAHIAGQGTLNNDFNKLAEEGLRRGESIGVIIALVVLLVVFGALVAALLPIILAIAAIAIALGTVALIGLALDLSFFISNMITMIGLAVGIDYSLFVVSRYREERARGREKLEAIARAGGTASRAVFFSGMTVVFALFGMLIVPNTIFRSLGLGAIVVVLFAIAASLTLLPAVLSLLGDRINKVRVRRRGSDEIDQVGGFWDQITRTVMGRPVLSLVLSAGVLVLLGSFYFSINTGFAGVSTLPDDIGSKQAFLILQEEFSGGLASPVEIVVDGEITPEVEDSIARLQEAMLADGRFGPSQVEPNGAGDLAVVSAPFVGDAFSEESTDGVHRLRDELVPAAFAGTNVSVLVGGDTAFNADFFEDASVYQPIVFTFVLGLSFLLLTVVFRSLVVPIKAIIMNLLSVGAAYGMIVLFFQADVGPAFVKDLSGWLGFIQVEAIEAWIPLFLFSVLFGLSMDYHVFLLSRIREHFDLTADNAESVAHGLRTTGAIITGAALIMVAVFGGFAAGDLVALQQMGFGLAVAVFLDATVVRSVLVPSTMRLLGKRNWYLPGWLDWLPQLDIEGHEAAAAARLLETPEVETAGVRGASGAESDGGFSE